MKLVLASEIKAHTMAHGTMNERYHICGKISNIDGMGQLYYSPMIAFDVEFASLGLCAPQMSRSNAPHMSGSIDIMNVGHSAPLCLAVLI